MIIVSAGMPRSGSTLLYNMIREVLISKFGENRVISKWREFFEPARPHFYYVVKTHELKGWHEERADKIYYSFRDIRSAMVSNFRKFGEPPSIEWVRKYIFEWRTAQRLAHAVVKFDTLIFNPLFVIEQLNTYLGASAEPVEIYQNIASYTLPSENQGPDPVTMLHAGHHTRTREDDWRYVLQKDLQLQISQEFGWWFEVCGYPVE